MHFSSTPSFDSLNFWVVLTSNDDHLITIVARFLYDLVDLSDKWTCCIN